MNDLASQLDILNSMPAAVHQQPSAGGETLSAGLRHSLSASTMRTSEGQGTENKHGRTRPPQPSHSCHSQSVSTLGQLQFDLRSNARANSASLPGGESLKTSSLSTTSDESSHENQGDAAIGVPPDKGPNVIEKDASQKSGYGSGLRAKSTPSTTKVTKQAQAKLKQGSEDVNHEALPAHAPTATGPIPTPAATISTRNHKGYVPRSMHHFRAPKWPVLIESISDGLSIFKQNPGQSSLKLLYKEERKTYCPNVARSTQQQPDLASPFMQVATMEYNDAAMKVIINFRLSHQGYQTRPVYVAFLDSDHYNAFKFKRHGVVFDCVWIGEVEIANRFATAGKR